MKIALKYESLVKSEETDLEFDFDTEGKTAKVEGVKARNITLVKIPSQVQFDGEIYSVTSIGSGAFAYCKNLTSIVIPNSVTTIGNSAFWGCTSLTSIKIPNSVTTIGESAFSGCTSLTSIEIPNSVTTIGNDAFNGCRSLTSIVVDKDNKVYDSRENCNAIIKTANNKLIKGCQNTRIPNSVTTIGEVAFCYCTSLASIVIPNSVTEIGKWAFYDCTSLASIVIPNSVTEIGNDAFNGCRSLTSIEIPNSVTTIGNDAFNGCRSLTSIVVDKDNKVYDSRENCNAIIKTANNKLIKGCQNTRIPNSVTTIGEVAFCYCTSLASIVIPNSVTEIGKWAFYDCTSLASIVIPESVTTIRNFAFGDCTSLTSIEIPNSVTEIGGHAFSGCTSLTSIVIPNSVTTIGKNAFDGCRSLTSIVIPNSVTEIGGHAFSGCTSLISIVVDKDNKVYDSRENCNAIIETATNILFSGCQKTVIPNSVTTIGKNAFEGCYSLKTARVPKGCKVDNNAFPSTCEIEYY